jgi:hypothetical protein
MNTVVRTIKERLELSGVTCDVIGSSLRVSHTVEGKTFCPPEFHLIVNIDQDDEPNDDQVIDKMSEGIMFHVLLTRDQVGPEAKVFVTMRGEHGIQKCEPMSPISCKGWLIYDSISILAV